MDESAQEELGNRKFGKLEVSRRNTKKQNLRNHTCPAATMGPFERSSGVGGDYGGERGQWESVHSVWRIHSGTHCAMLGFS